MSSPRRPRHRCRYDRRAAHVCAVQRRTRRGLRCVAQWRQRRGSRCRRREAHRRTPDRASGRHLREDRLFRLRHHRQLRLRHAHPAGGGGPGRTRRIPVPARLASHPDCRDRAAALGVPDVLGDGCLGLHAQQCKPARHHAGDRYPRRRRHRGDRKHRPSHAHGQVALPRSAQGADEIALQ